MGWFALVDPSLWLHSVLLQVPTPSSKSAVSPDVELLKSQLEFLKAENARSVADFGERMKLIVDENKSLSESFKTFVATMQFVLVVFGALGAFIVYVFKQNLEDARKVAQEMINQKVDQRISEIVDEKVEYVRRSLGRERVIDATAIDYLLLDGAEPKEVGLLRTRGFQSIRFCEAIGLLRRDVGDIVVVDLEHWQPDGKTGFLQMAKDEREARAKVLLREVLDVISPQSILVVYVSDRVEALGTLPKTKTIVPANSTITLVGTVADAAYVASGML